MGHADQRSGRPPARAITSVGPIACDADASSGSAREGSRNGHGRSATVRSTSPAATASGTRPIGSAKSIGTSTSWVGIAEPLPISNSTRETSA